MTEDYLLGEQIRQEKQSEETLAWIEKILDSLKSGARVEITISGEYNDSEVVAWIDTDACGDGDEIASLLLNNDNIRDKFIDNFNVEDLPEIISDKDWHGQV